MTTLADLNIDTADLPALHLATADEERPCPNREPIHQYSGHCEGGLYFDEEGVNTGSHATCNGTGAVPLLAGVRERCPYAQFDGDKAKVSSFQVDMEQALHEDGNCPCQGRGWVATGSTWRYLEAFRAYLGASLIWAQRDGGFEARFQREVAGGPLSTPWVWGEALELATMRAIAHALVAMKGNDG